MIKHDQDITRQLSRIGSQDLTGRLLRGSLPIDQLQTREGSVYHHLHHSKSPRYQQRQQPENPQKDDEDENADIRLFHPAKPLPPTLRTQTEAHTEHMTEAIGYTQPRPVHYMCETIASDRSAGFETKKAEMFLILGQSHAVRNGTTVRPVAAPLPVAQTTFPVRADPNWTRKGYLTGTRSERDRAATDGRSPTMYVSRENWPPYNTYSQSSNKAQESAKYRHWEEATRHYQISAPIIPTRPTWNGKYE